MNVQVSFTACTIGAQLEWPSDWPVPPVGSEIHVPNVGAWSERYKDYSGATFVRTVVWYPSGDDTPNNEPFIYMVIGPARSEGVY